MGQNVTDQTRFCQIPQGSNKDSNWHPKSKRVFIAVGLSFILTTSLMYYLMLSTPLSPPLPPASPKLAPHNVISINGDADFASTALLEGWPGDGSPENPFIIDRLEIDLDGEVGHGIIIGNTRVSFTISNCNLTGAYWDHGPCICTDGVAIFLANVTNGELVNNTCNSNCFGIYLLGSNLNTVVNNTCNSNDIGILLTGSNSNTVENNTCNNNTEFGIYLSRSDGNTVTSNTCFLNHIGIELTDSNSNTVVDNTCLNNNGDDGFCLCESSFNKVMKNTCNSNDIGIKLWISVYSTVTKNICNSNRIGIYLYFSENTNVGDNTNLYNSEHDFFEESGTEGADLGFYSLILL